MTLLRIWTSETGGRKEVSGPRKEVPEGDPGKQKEEKRDGRRDQDREEETRDGRKDQDREKKRRRRPAGRTRTRRREEEGRQEGPGPGEEERSRDSRKDQEEQGGVIASLCRSLRT